MQSLASSCKAAQGTPVIQKDARVCIQIMKKFMQKAARAACVWVSWHLASSSEKVTLRGRASYAVLHWVFTSRVSTDIAGQPCDLASGLKGRAARKQWRCYKQGKLQDCLIAFWLPILSRACLKGTKDQGARCSFTHTEGFLCAFA